MNCLKCGNNIENDDNFCHECGELTTHGYIEFKKNPDQVKKLNGYVIKQYNRLNKMFLLLIIFLVSFIIMFTIQGKDMFKPYIYLKKEIISFNYGYKISLIKTDNQYSKIVINDNNEAIKFIQKDMDEQNYLCNKNIDVMQIEQKIMDKTNIESVQLCDMSIDEAKKIDDVIEKIYNLFPNINGYLTNVTVTNAKNKNDYIAYFQPIYQFVNANEDINNYNKVNKTQILLNSYYFLNDNVNSKNINNYVEDGWYVKDSSLESNVAHEFGHYILFVCILKDNNIDNVIFIDKNNYKDYENILNKVNDGTYALNLVKEALNNYNIIYSQNIGIDSFALSISKYADLKNDKEELIAEETIAEAVHDYYLHGDKCCNASKEIIKILQARLNGEK